MVRWENENFLTSNLLCSFTREKLCPLVIFSFLNFEKKIRINMRNLISRCIFSRVWAKTSVSTSSSTIPCCWNSPNKTSCSATTCETPGGRSRNQSGKASVEEARFLTKHKMFVTRSGKASVPEATSETPRQGFRLGNAGVGIWQVHFE